MSRSHSDDAPELIKAAKALRWPHTLAPAGLAKHSGVGERSVRRVIEGGRELFLFRTALSLVG